MCGLPLFPSKPRHENLARTRRTLISAAARAVGSTLTAIPARSQYTPAERMRLFLKAEGEPK
jgi:hypothetical protein